MNVVRIVRKKVLGFFNSSFEFRCVNQECHTFGHFQQSDIAYERIMALWRVGSPFAQGSSKAKSVTSSRVPVRSSTLSSSTSSYSAHEITLAQAKERSKVLMRSEAVKDDSSVRVPNFKKEGETKDAIEDALCNRRLEAVSEESGRGKRALSIEGGLENVLSVGDMPYNNGGEMKEGEPALNVQRVIGAPTTD